MMWSCRDVVKGNFLLDVLSKASDLLPFFHVKINIVASSLGY